MKRNAFQFRRANEEDLPEICRIVKLAGEIVPVKEWFEAEDEEFLAKHKQIVLKPLNRCFGSGVMYLYEGDPNTRKMDRLQQS